MKIALISRYTYPFVSGGVEIHIWNLAKRLSYLGHNVEICSFKKSRNQEIQLDCLTKEIKITEFHNIISLSKYLLQGKFDIYHYHGYRDPLMALCVLITYNKKKNIFTPHAIFPGNSLREKFLKYLYDITLGYASLRLCKKIIALNTENRDQIKKVGTREKKIDIIPNCIEYDEYTKLPDQKLFRDTFGIKEDFILFIGRLNYFKGLDYAIKSMIGLKNYGSKLIIIGRDDGYKDKLVQYIQECNLEESVLILDSQPRQILLSALQACQSFILPSRHEGLPTVMLEAMACGKLVFASRNASQDVIIDGYNGFIFDNLNQKCMCDKIISIFGPENIDQNKIDQICKQAIETVKKEYSWETNVIKVEQIYKGIGEE